MANPEVASNFNQISGSEKKTKKTGFLCVPIAVARGGAAAKESEVVGLWREAVTLQLHVPLQPVNAGFVG